MAGLRYDADFVAADEAPELVSGIAALPFAPFEFQRWVARRRVVSFGWRYDFGDARLAPAPPLPDFLEPLRARAARWLGLPNPQALAQALVVEYSPGAGIGWHRDRPVFEDVVGVSLLAPCTLRLRLRRPDGSFMRAALPLAARSAYALTGAARQAWEHSIAPLTALRYSITFRSLRQR